MMWRHYQSNTRGATILSIMFSETISIGVSIFVMLSVIILKVLMLDVAFFIMMMVIFLNPVMLNVIVLSHYADCSYAG